MFERYIDAMTKTADVTLRWMMQRREMFGRLLTPSDAKQIAKEVAPYVVENISATVDVSEIVQEIDKLNESIERLGR